MSDCKGKPNKMIAANGKGVVTGGGRHWCSQGALALLYAQWTRRFGRSTSKHAMGILLSVR